MEISQTDRVKMKYYKESRRKLKEGALYLENSLWKAIWTRR